MLTYRSDRRWCPVCEKGSRRFQSGGIPTRANARCPICKSMERDRLAWIYLKQRTDIFDGRPKKMLHIAPEASLEPRLRSAVGEGYVTGDISRPGVSVQMDITAIPFPDESFDVIYCSHVLEHIVDDRKAMSELRRILKPNGWAILLVPITADATIEDPSVTDPATRLRLYGQDDHVRRYGPDYADRLAECGFVVTTTTSADLANAVDRVRMGLLSPETGDIFYCTGAASQRSR
jgi:SAM-dependent methyltransferase